ncbi:hypothetical protein CK203_049216 [Vitis vinifera]|uniref:Uncharacterized protein n=1 Tax=Vitis vinifera TaxID=29760 RepID=A0A438GKT0_VITVI|nr:hypothetical protein CK203_049216 [Vitis vinifera]
MREKIERRRWKGSSFRVESKVFEIGAEERKGKPQVIIIESKREVSSWVRLRPGECRVFSGKSESVHQGQGRRKMGNGMEGK